MRLPLINEILSQLELERFFAWLKHFEMRLKSPVSAGLMRSYVDGQSTKLGGKVPHYSLTNRRPNAKLSSKINFIKGLNSE